VGPCSGERRLTDAAAAFAAYADCDDRAHVEREAYLSAFQFGRDFADYLRRHGTTKGYAGCCWSPWLWFDIDRDAAHGGVEQARIDAAKLAVLLCDRYAVADDDLLIFYSGSKGFHVGLPTEFFLNAVPSPMFNRIARRLAERLGEVAGVTIDSGVYDQVRAFRAPNSRHPKTGLHKRRLSLKALMELGAAAITELAKNPEPFELPEPGKCDWNPSADWNEAAAQLDWEAKATAQRRAAVAEGTAAATLNRLTLAFIRDGADTGDRHRLLYSAARNLGEFGCSSPLAHALLTESALDSGLPPGEVRRQIECGLKDAANGKVQAEEVGAA
jgi:hypothetical protein